MTDGTNPLLILPDVPIESIPLEVDLVEDSDIEDELEDFSRLRRIGNIREAENFFDCQLRARMATDLFILIQYAEMLLEKGDYRALNELKEKPLFGSPDDKSPDPVKRLYLYWSLMQIIALKHCHSMDQSFNIDVIEEAISTTKPERDALELKIFVLLIRILSDSIDPETSSSATTLRNWKLKMLTGPDRVDLKAVRQQLQTDDRIWEFRDLFVTLCLYDSVENAMSAFFGSQSVTDLVGDWWGPDPDESTLLALLDMTVFVAMAACQHFPRTLEVIEMAEAWISEGETLRRSLLNKFPSSIYSRPVLLWIVAKINVSIAKNLPDPFSYLDQFPGFTIQPRGLQMAPIYLPLYVENPGLPHVDVLPTTYIQHLQMVLMAAKDLADYQMQCICLKTLLLWSNEPGKWLDQLIVLQNSIQLDRLGCLKTCLSGYIVCDDKNFRHKLLVVLDEFYQLSEILTSRLIGHDYEAARDILVHALSPRIRLHQLMKSAVVAVPLFNLLSTGFRQKMNYVLSTFEGEQGSPMRQKQKEDQTEEYRDGEISGQVEPGSNRLAVTQAIKGKSTAKQNPARQRNPLERASEPTPHTLPYRNSTDAAINLLERVAVHGSLSTAEQMVLGQLHYPDMNSRMEFIAQAHRHSFEWIFEDGAPLGDWLVSNDQLFWIRGKPGSGKSTLMKYLCTDAKVRLHLCRWSAAQKLVQIKYFFGKADTMLHSSKEGLLRSLLYQILRECPQLIPQAYPEAWQQLFPSTGEAEGMELTIRHEANVSLVPNSLVTTLLTVLTAIVNLDVKLCFFIDGLDEYDGHLSDIIDLLKKVADFPGIKICFSSRQHQIFIDEFQQVSHLSLDTVNQNDIRNYVYDKMRIDRGMASEMGEELGQELSSRIVEKANGSFLWAFLAVKSLKDGLRNGDSAPDLTRRLNHLPSTLADSYESILHRIEPMYRVQSAKILLIAANADRLPVLVYSFALDGSEMEDASRTKPNPLPFEEHNRRVRATTRKISAASNGLLEIRQVMQSEGGDGNLKSDSAIFSVTVSFIHTTAQNFLLQEHIQELLWSWCSPVFNPHEVICKGLLALFSICRDGADIRCNDEAIRLHRETFIPNCQLIESGDPEMARELRESAQNIFTQGQWKLQYSYASTPVNYDIRPCSHDQETRKAEHTIISRKIVRNGWRRLWGRFSRA